jgi:hypothetical protein
MILQCCLYCTGTAAPVSGVKNIDNTGGKKITTSNTGFSETYAPPAKITQSATAYTQKPVESAVSKESATGKSFSTEWSK